MMPTADAWTSMPSLAADSLLGCDLELPGTAEVPRSASPRKPRVAPRRERLFFVVLGFRNHFRFSCLEFVIIQPQVSGDKLGCGGRVG